jgi:hypothetical protein
MDGVGSILVPKHFSLQQNVYASAPARFTSKALGVYYHVRTRSTPEWASSMQQSFKSAGQ